MEVPSLNASRFKLIFFSNFNHTSGTNASIFYYYSVTISLISIEPQEAMFGLPTCQFSAAYDQQFAL